MRRWMKEHQYYCLGRWAIAGIRLVTIDKKQRENHWRGAGIRRCRMMDKPEVLVRLDLLDSELSHEENVLKE